MLAGGSPKGGGWTGCCCCMSCSCACDDKPVLSVPSSRLNTAHNFTCGSSCLPSRLQFLLSGDFARNAITISVTRLWTAGCGRSGERSVQKCDGVAWLLAHVHWPDWTLWTRLFAPIAVLRESCLIFLGHMETRSLCCAVICVAPLQVYACMHGRVRFCVQNKWQNGTFT